MMYAPLSRWILAFLAFSVVTWGRDIAAILPGEVHREESEYWKRILQEVGEMSVPTPSPTEAIETPSPTPSPTSNPDTPEPTEASSPEPTSISTPEPTSASTPEPTIPSTPPPASMPTAEPTPDPCDGVVCDLPNAEAVCIDGDCVISSCDEGFGNCDDIDSTGCEAELESDIDNCGECGTSCEAICFDGVCDNPNPECAGASCDAPEVCIDSGECSIPVCTSTAEGGGVCIEGTITCESLTPCEGGTADCPAGSLCLVDTCCGFPVCAQPEVFCVIAEGSEADGLESNGTTIGEFGARL